MKQMLDVNGHPIFDWTLRDYFAAHAPRRPEIMDAFVTPPYPPYPITSMEGITMDEQNAALNEANRQYTKNMIAYNLQLQKLRMQQEVDWRYEYADAMMARRDVTK